MEKMHKVYKATITTLTPLHIGTGTRLLKDYDYVSRGGKTWVINNDELAQQLGDPEDPGFQELMRAKPAELMREDDYTPDNPLWRYILPGVINAETTGSELQEMVKDPWDRPYIPGSSLKGAIRTALAIALWPAGQPVPYSEIQQKRVKQAAEPMEDAIFYGSKANRGSRPNYDLMRAMHIADSVADVAQQMDVYAVKVVTGEKPQSPIALEAVRPGVTFETTITLDLNLLGRAQVLGWSEAQVKALRNFRPKVNLHTQRRLTRLAEVNWRNGPPGLVSFYDTLFTRLVEVDKTKTGFITQLGWGGGWDSKTFGALLTADSAQFAQLVQTFGRFMDKQNSYKAGQLYPKSRRVVVTHEDKPRWPFGWIEVKLEARS